MAKVSVVQSSDCWVGGRELRLPRYDLVRFIAAGANGAVFRAQDSLLSRTVALKAYPLNVAGDTRDKRKQAAAEAAKTASLQHRNIAQVFDAFLAEDLFVTVMELVEGRLIEPQLSSSSIRMVRAAS